MLRGTRLAHHGDAGDRATKPKMKVAAPATATRLDHSETVGFTLPSSDGSGITGSGGIGLAGWGAVIG